jgi:protein subunit release factor B
MAKHLLFSLTAKDFEVQTFCTGGNGGQHRNAKQNGVRIIHLASGARAEHRDGRDQGKNKAAAFEKLAQSKLFLEWHKLECARRLGMVREAEAVVEEAMRPANIKVEVKDTEGKWCDGQMEDAGR